MSSAKLMDSSNVSVLAMFALYNLLTDEYIRPSMASRYKMYDLKLSCFLRERSGEI